MHRNPRPSIIRDLRPPVELKTYRLLALGMACIGRTGVLMLVAALVTLVSGACQDGRPLPADRLFVSAAVDKYVDHAGACLSARLLTSTWDRASLRVPLTRSLFVCRRSPPASLFVPPFSFPSIETPRGPVGSSSCVRVSLVRLVLTSQKSPLTCRYITQTAGKMKDPELACIFSNTLPNTLDTTVQFGAARRWVLGRHRSERYGPGHVHHHRRYSGHVAPRFDESSSSYRAVL